MAAGLIVLIVLACIWTYAVVAGFVGTRLHRHFQERCPKMDHRYCEHVTGGVFSGALWPFALPVSVGVVLGRYKDERLLKIGRRTK